MLALMCLRPAGYRHRQHPTDHHLLQAPVLVPMCPRPAGYRHRQHPTDHHWSRHSSLLVQIETWCRGSSLRHVLGGVGALASWLVQKPHFLCRQEQWRTAAPRFLSRTRKENLYKTSRSLVGGALAASKDSPKIERCGPTNCGAELRRVLHRLKKTAASHHSRGLHGGVLEQVMSVK